MEDSRPLLLVLAFVAFVISLSASLYVLLPKRNLVFSLVGPRAYEEMFEFRDDMSEVHRRLAYDLDRFWEANDGKMQRLFRSVQVAVASLAAEVGLLLGAAADTLY